MTERDQRASAESLDLSRFLKAQEKVYPKALSELIQGHKKSHWMWFIFPQIEGLGSSPTAKFYAIKDLSEAHAYCHHPVLGGRLVECAHALLSHSGKTASDIMGFPDDLKLNSSMTLFSQVKACPAEFTAVIDKYYEGQSDQRTLAILGV